MRMAQDSSKKMWVIIICNKKYQCQWDNLGSSVNAVNISLCNLSPLGHKEGRSIADLYSNYSMAIACV